MITLPLTYTDLICVDDLDPFANETTSDLQNLIQDIGHLLKEFPGTNPDDPDRGIGVETYLSGTLDNFRNLSALIESQVTKDPRVDTCTCSIDTSTENFTVNISVGVSGTVIPLEFGWSDGNFTNLTP